MIRPSGSHFRHSGGIRLTFRHCRRLTYWHAPGASGPPALILSYSMAGTPAVDEYVQPVYRYALRLTRSRPEAEDLTQETFLQAWRRRGQLRASQATRVWLFSIATNLWRDWLRREKRRRRLAEQLDEAYQSAASAPDRDLIVQDEVRRVLRAMDCLPRRQREVLYLHACEELALGEIAAVLGISSEAVKASLCLARKHLRRQFRENDCGHFGNVRSSHG